MRAIFVFALLWVGTFSLRELATASEREPANAERVVAVENVCAWPNLTLMPDGTVIAVFFNQPAHGTREGDIDCYASRDGLVWEKRSTVTAHDPRTVRMNHAAGLARNGDLVVLCSGWTDVKQDERPKQAPFRDNILRSWVSRSKDGGRTWEKRDAFPAAEGDWSEHIPFGDIWAGEDGALHTSCYQGEFVDPSKSTKTKGWRSWHFQSDDDGSTWRAVSIIGPKHNETDIFPLGGDKWLAAARIDAMELFRSDDNGATWTGPERVTEKNEINGQLAKLKDGRLLLSYGVRVDGRRGVLAKLSDDDGRTWGEPLRIAAVTDGADCGYPSSVQLPNGKIVTAWYANRTPDHEGYHLGVTVWDAPAK
ncbi:MAG: exo-alpha-sialidase [Verrucomicrobiae bacterium]|nr:exo-alpha-sialidase [Verrucomicrobiae bacterium]